MSRTWFITGASRGLGHAFVVAALDRGDRVVATARDPRGLTGLSPGDGELLTLPLDVTDGDAARRAVATAAEHFGGLDVVVNNAGAGARGAFEELPDEAFRAAMDVNLFGVAAVVRAALPLMRAQQHGHLVQISSLGGLVALPLASAYVASKWALEGLSEALAQEVAGFGVRVTIVEPGPFATQQGGGTAAPVPGLAAYDPLREALGGQPQHLAPGDPADAARSLLRIVDAPEPPLRVVLGAGGTAAVRQVYERRLQQLEDAERMLGAGSGRVPRPAP